MVFLNKIDTVKDKELVDLVEEEIRELLTSYKFPGDKTPIAKGSALAAVEGRDDEIGKNSVIPSTKPSTKASPYPIMEFVFSLTSSSAVRKAGTKISEIRNKMIFDCSIMDASFI